MIMSATIGKRIVFQVTHNTAHTTRSLNVFRGGRASVSRVLIKTPRHAGELGLQD
jgi:hypothetical protein